MAPRKEVHTVATDKGWANKAANHRRISNHRTKALAERAGRKQAIERQAKHVIHKKDGSIGAMRHYAA